MRTLSLNTSLVLTGRFLAIVLSMALSVAGWAQTGHADDPHDLDYATNLASPAVPTKQKPDIQTHMRSIANALARLDYVVELRRDNEAVTLVVPCADLFASNDTVLKAGGKARLQHLAKILQYPTMYKVVVAVYSDDTGEPQYCEALTEARADAIYEQLADIARHNNFKGVNVIPYGLGQADYIADNDSMVGRALNRRVEITILPESGMLEAAKAGKLNR